MKAWALALALSTAACASVETSSSGEVTSIRCFSACTVVLSDGKPVRVDTSKTGLDWAAAAVSIVAIVWGVH